MATKQKKVHAGTRVKVTNADLMRIPEGTVGKVQWAKKGVARVNFPDHQTRLVHEKEFVAALEVLPAIPSLVVEYHYLDGDVGAHPLDDPEHLQAAEVIWNGFSSTRTRRGRGYKLVIREAGKGE